MTITQFTRDGGAKTLNFTDGIAYTTTASGKGAIICRCNSSTHPLCYHVSVEGEVKCTRCHIDRVFKYLSDF